VSLTNGALSLAIAASILIYFSYAYFIIDFIGEKYAGTEIILIILLCAVPIYIQGSFIDIYLVLKGRANLLLAKTGIAFGIKISCFFALHESLNIEMIPLISVASAVISTISITCLYDRKFTIFHLITLNPLTILKSFKTISRIAK
jgi:O-antigen/teichoic acid export membrane protein